MSADAVTLTDAEEAALAPYLDDLHPADLESILRRHRTQGYGAPDSRLRGETRQPFGSALTPDALDAARQGIRDCAATQYRIRTPQNRGISVVS